MIARHMPADWTPPAPAWIGEWDGPAEVVVMAVFGVQSADAAGFRRLLAWFDAAIDAGDAPYEAVFGEFVDGNSLHNRVLIAYWPQSVFQRWWARPGTARWWRAPERLDDGCGYWREIMQVPFERRETLYSSQQPEGMGRAAARLAGPVREHGYWGSARDRIPASAHDALAGCPALPAAHIDGNRVRLSALPGLCVIRSGQDWSQCEARERAWYLERIEPVLQQGMRYLVEHPVEAGCSSCRFIRQTDRDGKALDKSFALAYFPDMADLEAWARDHPTHHAIFGGFMDMVTAFEGQLALRLWHEVFVLDQRPVDVEYIACHPSTGFLRSAGEG